MGTGFLCYEMTSVLSLYLCAIDLLSPLAERINFNVEPYSHCLNNLKFYVNTRIMVSLYFMCIAYHYDDKLWGQTHY